MTEPRGRAVFLYAGAGGTCLGAKAAGIEGPGIELDPIICRTRIAAGLETIEGSVLDYGPADFPDATGLVGTPPCQLFSTAGTGEARKMLPEILAAVAAMGRGEKPDTEGWPLGALLVLEPLRWIIEAANLGRPYEWVVLEQVPPVLPIWQAYGEVLSAGYGVAAANLQAECWGVPQTRKRAIFVARLGKPAKLPTPTHSRYYPRDPKRLDPGVLPWVSMAEALDGEFGMTARPSMTVCAGGGDTGGAEPFGSGARKGMERELEAGNFVYRSSTMPNSAYWQMRSSVSAEGYRKAPDRPVDTPSATITGKHRSADWVGPQTIRVTVQEAGILQSFPPDFPWAGDPEKPATKTMMYRMAGNSAPPLLVEAVVCALLEN